MHFAATGAMHGHGLLYLTLRRSTTLAPTQGTPTHCRRFADPITGRFVVLGLPDLNVLVMGANAQAFCSSGIGEDVAGNRLGAKRSTRRTMGFSEVARNFALIPRAPARPSCRAVRGSRSTDPAGAAALGPVVLWEIALLRAEFWRVRDTLCMSVVLSINTSETGLARNGSKRSRGFSFKMPRWVALRFQRVKHDSALVHKGANWNADFLSNQLLNASV